MTTEQSARPYYNYGDEALLMSYEAAQHTGQEMREEIERRILERGATAIPSETYRCEMVQTSTYDQPSFAPLKELLNEADLKTCWTPAWEETIKVTHAESWDVQKVKALATRYGSVAQAIVGAAIRPGRSSLKFERRVKQPAK